MYSCRSSREVGRCGPLEGGHPLGPHRDDTRGARCRNERLKRLRSRVKSSRLSRAPRRGRGSVVRARASRRVGSRSSGTRSRVRVTPLCERMSRASAPLSDGRLGSETCMISEALESAGAANALPWSPPKDSALEAHHVRRLRDCGPGDRPQLDRERELLGAPPKPARASRTGPHIERGINLRTAWGRQRLEVQAAPWGLAVTGSRQCVTRGLRSPD